MLTNFPIYFVGRVLVVGIPMLLIPILTHAISPEDYGLIGIFIAIYQILNIFIGLGGVGAVVRAYMDRNDNTFCFKEYLFNAILVNIFLFLLALTPFYIFYTFNIVSLPNSIMFLLPFIVIVSGFKKYKHKLWNIQGSAQKFTVFEVAFIILSFGLSVILVLTIFPDWRGRIYSIAFAEVVFCTISLFYLFKEDGVVYKFNKGYCIDVLKFGIPLLPHSMALTLIASSDKLLLGSLLGMHEVGIFTVAFGISSILMVTTMAIDQTIQPIMYNFLKNQTKVGKRMYVAGFYLYFLVLILSGLMLYLLTPLAVDMFIGSEFQSASDYVGVLIIGQVGYSMYRYTVKSVFFSKKTHLVSTATISSAAIGLILQYTLIVKYGIMGAAIGTACMHVLSFVFILYFSNKLYPMPWSSSIGIIKDLPKIVSQVFIKQYR
jgi:O-antigen/teichoic acid export membrane protein